MTVAQVPPPNDRRQSSAPHLAGERASLRERSIRYVKGVGPHRLSQLAQLGIQTVEDACYYPPRRYEDRTRLAPIHDVRPGEVTTIRGKVLAKGLRRIRGGQTIFEAAIGDSSGILYGVWFNQPYLERQLTVGEEVILYGRLDAGSRAQMMHPEIERVEADDAGSSIHMGRIVPMYPLTIGIGQRWFRQMLFTTLERYVEALDDPLPESMRHARQWPDVSRAIRELHFPSSWEALQLAQERLAFDELFLFQLALAQRRARTMTTQKPQRYQLDGPLSQGLRRRLPFALTASQERVLAELLEDLRQPAAMHRLLQGDVGCGKTVVLMFLIAVAVQSGWQVALMAPTELLAEQHARVISELLTPLGVSVGLLAQSVTQAKRVQRAAAIANGAIDVIIGTQALIQRRSTFKRLALVIIDEQHKFGVIQRAHLAKKSEVPDVLVLTATPIPRTLALSLYGDLAVSTITELPPGRQPITTRWLQDAQRGELYEAIRRELTSGHQGYVVYPLVEEQRTAEVKAATQMAKRLQDVFPEFRVGLLHGQMKPKDKEQTMRDFAQGELQLLVSTVIVEVGLDVPNATMMVIEHPERFGLAQLHQLRGRIGRGRAPATCLLVSDTTDEAVRGRLAAFVDLVDGFELAEKDLELRGPGELLGRRQHGWVRFRLANLSRDRALLESARQEAIGLIAKDPALQDPSLKILQEQLARFREHAV